MKVIAVLKACKKGENLIINLLRSYNKFARSSFFLRFSYVQVLTPMPVRTAETTADATSSGSTSTQIPAISTVMTAAERTTAGGRSSPSLVSVATAETTMDTGTSATTFLTIPTADTTTDGEITVGPSTIVTTAGVTVGDGMNNSTATPMITMYSLPPYINGVNGNGR